MKDTITKHYDKLDVRARLALIVNAWHRSDTTDADRLIASAPRAAYTVPNHYFAHEAWRRLSFGYLAYQLGSAVALWRGLCALESLDEDAPHYAQAYEALGALSFALLKQHEGWALVCQSLSIEPPGDIGEFPAYSALRETLEMAALFALSEEEMQQQAAARGGVAVSAQQFACDWRHTFEQMAA